MHKALFLGALSLAMVTASHAAVLTVTNTNNSGPGSLRQCIADAEPGDEIQFDPGLDGKPIRFTGLMILPGWKNLTIKGRGPERTFLEAINQINPTQIQLRSGEATLSGITVRSLMGWFNGAILNEGTLTLRECQVQNSFAAVSGGAIANEGTLNIQNCRITDNSAQLGGGAIFNSGTLHIIHSVIHRNTVTNYDIFNGRGGAISNIGSVTIEDSTISSSRAPAYGGAIFHWGDGELKIVRSTLAHNYCRYYGGAISNGGRLTILNSTISDNNSGWAGGGIDNTGTVVVRDSTVYGNGRFNILNSGEMSSANSILGFCVIWTSSVESGGHNLDSDDSCGLDHPDDLLDVEPMLGALEENGGPTITRAPQHGSPVIDAGACHSEMDQRGVRRPLDGNADGARDCDIGAVEHIPVTVVGPGGDVITVPGHEE